MSTRTAGAVVLTFVALGIAGCGEGSTAAWAEPKRSASAAPTAGSPSPSVDRAALQEKAKAATVAPKGFAGIGISANPKDDKPVTYNLTLACGQQPDADKNSVRVSYNRTWSATGWWVSNTAHAYGTATGADAVPRGRGRLRLLPADQADRRHVRELPRLPRQEQPGVERVGGARRDPADQLDRAHDRGRGRGGRAP